MVLEEGKRQRVLSEEGKFVGEPWSGARWNIKDCFNPNPDRYPHLLSVFALESKIQKEYLNRRLYCIVTVGNEDGSEDIYNGFLPTTNADASIVLPLTGPGNFLEASYIPVHFTVSLYDVDDPKSSAAATKVHVCDRSCEEYKSCGSHPSGEWMGHSKGLFLWYWHEESDSFQGFCSVNLLDYNDGVPIIDHEERVPPHSLLGCSLHLKYAAYLDAVVAKVKVVVDKAAIHNICIGCGYGLTITADCGDIYDGMVLFQKDVCRCLPRWSNEIENNIDDTTPEEEEEEGIELSRPLVTMPCPTRTPTILKVRASLHNNDTVEDCASFVTQRWGTFEKCITGQSGETLLRVIVKWI